MDDEDGDSAAEPWFYVDPRGSRQGPHNFRVLRAQLRCGLLSGETLVWREGMGTWRPAREFPVFASCCSGEPRVGYDPAPTPAAAAAMSAIETLAPAPPPSLAPSAFASAGDSALTTRADRPARAPLPAPPPGSPPVSPSRRHEWYAVVAGGSREGPMSTAELLNLLNTDGESASQTWVWCETAQPEWAPAERCAELSSALRAVGRIDDARATLSGAPRASLRASRGPSPMRRRASPSPSVGGGHERPPPTPNPAPVPAPPPGPDTIPERARTRFRPRTTPRGPAPPAAAPRVANAPVPARFHPGFRPVDRGRRARDGDARRGDHRRAANAPRNVTRTARANRRTRRFETRWRRRGEVASRRRPAAEADARARRTLAETGASSEKTAERLSRGVLRGKLLARVTEEVDAVPRSADALG